MHMPLFTNKDTVLIDEAMQIGEFDISAEGAYRNVKTFPLEVKQGDLFISVDSDNPIDVAVSDEKGMCIKFKESITDEVIGPITIKKKATMMMVIGIFRGDKAELKLKVWMQ